MRYKVNYGEEIAIVGNIPQLGNWTDTGKAKLRWTQGDIWVIEGIRLDVNDKVNTGQKQNKGSFFFEDFHTSHKKISPYFQYKYCVIDSHSR